MLVDYINTYSHSDKVIWKVYIVYLYVQNNLSGSQLRVVFDGEFNTPVYESILSKNQIILMIGRILPRLSRGNT